MNGSTPRRHASWASPWEVARAALRAEEQGEGAEKIIATHIIELAQAGERDANRLCEYALAKSARRTDVQVSCSSLPRRPVPPCSSRRCADGCQGRPRWCGNPAFDSRMNWISLWPERNALAGRGLSECEGVASPQPPQEGHPRDTGRAVRNGPRSGSMRRAGGTCAHSLLAE